MSITLAKGVVLPAEAATETFAILAKRGKGKTYTMLRSAEQMIAQGTQVIIVDVVGVCWGIRCNPDGSPNDLDIVIAGGDHADVPMADTHEAGETLARVAVETGRSFVVDVSHFSKAGGRRVVTGLCKALYHQKSPQNRRTPLHVFIDEADEFAPQRAQPDVAACLGAVDTAVRRGRAKGLGFTLVTQRPAVLNKDVLTQAEVLIAMGLIANQDRKAIDAWVSAVGEEERKGDMMSTLAKLSIGEAWVWTPQYDVFKRVKIAQRETYDSSSTPKHGEGIKAAKLKALDVARLAQMLTEAPDDAKATAKSSARDKKKIAELELQITELKHQLAGQDQVWRDRIMQLASEVAVDAPKRPESGQPAKSSENKALSTQSSPRHHRLGESISVTASNAEDRLLESLAWWRAAGEHEPGIEQLAFMAGIRPKSSTLRAARATLKQQGLISQVQGSRTRLTDAGAARAARFVPNDVTMTVYHNRIRAMISGGVTGRVFDYVLAAGCPVDIDELAAAVDVSPDSSTIRAALAELRKLGVITKSRPVDATELMYPVTLVA